MVTYRDIVKRYPATSVFGGDFRNLVYKAWQVLGLPNPTEVQYDVAAFLQRGPDRSRWPHEAPNNRVMVQGFRGLAKSTITACLATWEWVLDVDAPVFVVSSTSSDARMMSQLVLDLLDNVPELQYLAPTRDQRSSVIAFDVAGRRPAKAPSLKSVGIAGGIVGSRGKLIIPDDIEAEHKAYTQAGRDRVESARKQFDSVLMPGGRITMLGTPQSELSVYNELPRLGYSIWVWPARYPGLRELEKYRISSGNDLVPRAGALVPARGEEHLLGGRPVDSGNAGELPENPDGVEGLDGANVNGREPHGLDPAQALSEIHENQEGAHEKNEGEKADDDGHDLSLPPSHPPAEYFPDHGPGVPPGDHGLPSGALPVRDDRDPGLAPLVPGLVGPGPVGSDPELRETLGGPALGQVPQGVGDGGPGAGASGGGELVLVGEKRLAPLIVDRLLADPSLASGGLSPRFPGQPVEPGRFDDEDLLRRELSLGGSAFALQFMLDVSLSDADRYPLRLRDLSVLDLDPDTAPDRVVWASSPDLEVKGLPVVGLHGDRYYRAMSVSTERSPYQESVLFVDPAGRGKDEVAWAVVKHLNGKLYLAEAVGLPGGYEGDTLERIAQTAKIHRVSRVLVEPNFADGMAVQLLRPVLARVYPTIVEEGPWATGQKELRIIRTLEPVLNQHRLVVDRGLIERDHRIDVRTHGEQAHTYSLMYQLTRITAERGCLRHDDRLDALAGAVAYFTDRMRLDEEKATVANRRRMSEKQAREWLSAAHWTGKKQAGLSTLEGRVGQLKGRAPKRPGRGEKRSWRVSRGPKPGRGGPI